MISSLYFIVGLTAYRTSNGELMWSVDRIRTRACREGDFGMKTIVFLCALAVATTCAYGQQTNVRWVDDFHGALDKDWFWVRENPDGWRLTDAGLKILVEPGTMWSKTSDAKNVLLRKLPEGWESGVDITCELWHSPKKRWEQANLVWYFDASHMVKLGLEIEHGVANIVMGRKEKNQRKTLAIIPYADPDVQLRLTVNGQKLVGYSRKPGAEKWTRVAETNLPTPPENATAHISLQCYGGEAGSDRWARFGSLTIEY